MEISYGAQVVDKNERLLGSVDLVIRNILNGEIIKFMVHRKAPSAALFFKPEDVLEGTDTKVKLNIAIDESTKSV